MEYLPQQSPIDLGKANPLPIRFPCDYLVPKWSNILTGRVDSNKRELNFYGPEPRNLLFNGKLYPLLKFHFHRHSEHKVNGGSWPFEMHMVHGQSPQGPFIVLAIFAEKAEGKHNADTFFSELAEQFDENSKTDNGLITINPYSLLPENQINYYRYEGSLTTHHDIPNPENVSWVIYKNPISVNAETLTRFAALLHGSRTVQDLNRRFVLFNTGSCCCDNDLKSGDT